jgi:hypothetical protein
VVSVLELGVTTGALAVSAGLVAASLRVRAPVAFLLASYVVAYAEIVIVTTTLSLFHWVGRWEMIVMVAVLLAASVAAWTAAGRPRGPSPACCFHRLIELLRDRALAVLAVGVALGFVYIAALAVFTPPNSVDALWYHLARVAFWKQQHAVGYIANANDQRLNAFPPVGEMAVLYTVVVAGVDRFVTLIALSAYVVLPLTVFGIARRVGVNSAAAAFAGLAFATLPVVVLQGSGALNDLVIASFLAICVYFALGSGTVEAVLAGMALALAFGTKAYAPFTLPIIALIVALGTTRSRATRLAAIGAVAVIVGSTWNLINLAWTGAYEGHVANETADVPFDGFLSLVAMPTRYLLNFAEVPGARGWWIAAYLVPGALVAALFLFRRPANERASPTRALLVALVPFLAIAAVPAIARIYRVVLFHLGRPDLGILGYGRSVFTATPMISYYGPLGLILLLAPILILASRPRARAVILALAAAPLLFLFVLTVAIGYGELNGRFFAFAIAFSAVSLSPFLRDRLIRWTVVVLALPTLALALRANIEKPPSIWSQPRWQVQTRAGMTDAGEADVIRFAETSIPAGAHIGLALWDTEWSYPFFGPHLQHVVSFVPSTASVPHDVSWLVVAPRMPAPSLDWHEVLRASDDFRLYRRQHRLS